MSLNSMEHGIVQIPEGGLIDADRVALNPRDAGSARVGLLTAWPGEASEVCRPVRILPVAAVPPAMVAVGETLAETLGISDGVVPWRLTFGALRHRVADALCLEVTIEGALNRFIGDLERSASLVGRLVWLGDAQTRGALHVDVDGVPYRVREVVPEPGADTIVEIGEKTEVRLFAPGIKAGVDIVILADCSGSMRVTDMSPESAGVEAVAAAPSFIDRVLRRRPASTRISRMEALHHALLRLLEMRLQQSGRVSRIALVGFTTHCEVYFPSQGGMAQFDDHASEALVGDFRGAVGLLRSRTQDGGGTDIANALHYAAELLHRNRREGNDRLIVLISDGRQWVPKNDDAAGEEIGGIEDPVVTMAHIHRTLGVRLHAIGIGTRDQFLTWWRQQHGNQTPQEGLIPDHELLEELVAVAGGDPTRCGDTEVLEEYFSGLGTGLMGRVRVPRAGSLPALQRFEEDVLAQASTRATSSDRDQQVQRDELARAIFDDYLQCNEYATRYARRSRALFETSDQTLRAMLRDLTRPVSDAALWPSFILATYQAFCEGADRRVFERDPRVNPYGHLRGVVELMQSGALANIALLRHMTAHDKSRDYRDQEKVALFVEQLIGRRMPECSEDYLRLQHAVLRFLADFLSRLRQAFAADAAAAPAEDPGAGGFRYMG